MKDERLLYVALAALGGLMGLAISLSQPLIGFFIMGGTITLSILGLMVNLKNTVSDKLPSFGDRTIEENRTTVIIGVLTLASFIPFLFPEVLLATALLIFLVAGLMFYMIKQGAATTDSTIEDVAKLGLAGTMFLVASQISFLLILAPAFLFLWFLWTLLTKNKQKQLMRLIQS